MDNRRPQTKEECFALLDAMLSEEDKNELQNCEDTINYHFTLGMWIRNNWIYSLKDYERESFMKMFMDKSELSYGIYFFHPDEYSSIIIDKYVEYLKNKE
jgi:hypothetical protein